MKRKLQSTCRCPAKRKAGFNRYLRPGALAQLRDSRIIARSQRSGSNSQVSTHPAASPHSSPVRSPAAPQATPAAAAIDSIPCSPGKISSGPRLLQRKKLFAAESARYVPSSSTAGTVPGGAPGLGIDPLSSDIVVAH